MKSLTARYVKTSTGYMGQIMEWPEVVTEGTDLEDCRESLRDAQTGYHAALEALH